MVFISVLTPRSTVEHFADDDPENQDCRSLIDPSVVKMCTGDLIAMLCITFWFCFLFWFCFSGYKRLRAFYRARLAQRFPFSCSCMRRKDKSSKPTPYKPFRARLNPGQEKQSDEEPGPLDPYLIVPHRISETFVVPTCSPTSPPPTYHPASRKSIQDPISYAFATRSSTSPTSTGSPKANLPKRSSTASLGLGLGFGDSIHIPSPALGSGSPVEHSFLNFYSDPMGSTWSATPKGPSATSTPKKPAKQDATLQKGWVMIESV